MRILVNTPTKLQNDENGYNIKPDYCKQNKDDANSTICRKLDGLSLSWPIESRSITLATFIKETWQRSEDCQYALVYDPENPVKYEDLRLVLSHCPHGWICTYTKFNGNFTDSFFFFIIITLLNKEALAFTFLCF